MTKKLLALLACFHIISLYAIFTETEMTDDDVERVLQCPAGKVPVSLKEHHGEHYYCCRPEDEKNQPVDWRSSWSSRGSGLSNCISHENLLRRLRRDLAPRPDRKS